MNTPKQDPHVRILVIDDEPGQREMLVYGLSERGYHVTAAASGEEAIGMATRQEFELALSDMKMPGLSGVEVIRAIKQLQPNMEITIATGFATLENAVESYERGAYDYISKPYDLDELCGLLERALERREKRMIRAA